MEYNGETGATVAASQCSTQEGRQAKSMSCNEAAEAEELKMEASSNKRAKVSEQRLNIEDLLYEVLTHITIDVAGTFRELLAVTLTALSSS